MNRQDAIAHLARAGKSAQAVELVRKASDTLDQTYAGIRQDRTWSEGYKRQKMAAAYLRGKQQVDTQLIALAAGVSGRDRQDAGSVFGVRDLPGDVATLSVSRRDAADRVAKVEDAAELRSLLARAERGGDEVLARAVAERALEMRDADTMNDFLGARPALEAAGERLWEAQAQGEKGSLMLGFQMVVSQPSELSGVNEWELESMAEAASAGGIDLASA